MESSSCMSRLSALVTNLLNPIRERPVFAVPDLDWQLVN